MTVSPAARIRAALPVALASPGECFQGLDDDVPEFELFPVLKSTKYVAEKAGLAVMPRKTTAANAVNIRNSENLMERKLFIRILIVPARTFTTSPDETWSAAQSILRSTLRSQE